MKKEQKVKDANLAGFNDALDSIEAIEFDIDEVREYMKIIQRDIMKAIDFLRKEKKDEAIENGQDPETVDLTDDEIRQIVQDYVEEYKKELTFPGQYPTDLLLECEAYRTLEKLYDTPQYKREFSELLETVLYQYKMKQAPNRSFLERSKDLRYAKDFQDYFLKVFPHMGENLYREMFSTLTSIAEEVLKSQTKKGKKDGKVINPDEVGKRIIQRRQELEKRISIPRIQEYSEYLNYYGFMDQYINESNEILESLGLGELRAINRNPLSENIKFSGPGAEELNMQIDRTIQEMSRYLNGETPQTEQEAGSSKKSDQAKKKDKKDKKKQKAVLTPESGELRVEKKKIYSENIGVMDFLRDEEELQQQSADTLVLLEMLFGSKYFDERKKMERAMSTIRLADLWKQITSGQESQIDEIPEQLLLDTQKRKRAITFFHNGTGAVNSELITPNLKRAYTMFLKKKGLLPQDPSKKTSIEDDATLISEDMSSLITMLVSLNENRNKILSRLASGKFHNMRWGMVDKRVVLGENYEKFKDMLEGEEIIVLDCGDLNGPITLSVPVEIIKKMQCKIPQYQNQEVLKSDYLDAMERLLLVSNPYIRKKEAELCKMNPDNALYQYIANRHYTCTSQYDMDNSPASPDVPQ